MRHGRTGPHWLDAAGPDPLVADIKVLLGLLLLAVPLPVFWALFDMIGSRWTFQVGALPVENGKGCFKVTWCPKPNGAFHS